jgi:hypothetical protein
MRCQLRGGARYARGMTTTTALRERVEAAAAAPPLSELSAADRAELEAELASAGSFEDLRGKWQAAVLAAELGPQAGGGSCGCHQC